MNRPQGSVYIGRHRTQKITSPPVGFTEESISCSYQGATKSKEIMQLREGNVFTDVCVSTVGLLGASHASWDRSHSRVPSPRTWDLGTSPPPNNKGPVVLIPSGTPCVNEPLTRKYAKSRASGSTNRDQYHVVFSLKSCFIFLYTERNVSSFEFYTGFGMKQPTF